MPQYTLLDLTQKILSSMDSDEINSISDTTEAQQVVDIIETVYFDIAALGELPRDDDFFSLQSSGNGALPVTMYIPSNVEEIYWLKYNYASADQPQAIYQSLKPLPLWDFVNMVTGLDPTESDVTTYTHIVGTDTFTLYCRNNIPPVYYTTADDRTLLFDGYDSTVDSTLQSSKSMAFGRKGFAWTAIDTFVLPLDDLQLQRLLHEAKSLAFAELKQSQHVKAEKSARDIKIIQQSSKTKLPLETAYDKINLFARKTRVGTKPTGRYK